jgi:hypothetical protein
MFPLFLTVCSLATTWATLCIPPAPTIELRDVPYTPPAPNTTFIPTSCESAQVFFGLLRVRKCAAAPSSTCCVTMTEKNTWFFPPNRPTPTLLAIESSTTTRFCAVSFDPRDRCSSTSATSPLPPVKVPTVIAWAGQSGQSVSEPFTHVPFGVAGDCRTGGASVCRPTSIFAARRLLWPTRWRGLPAPNTTNAAESRAPLCAPASTARWSTSRRAACAVGSLLVASQRPCPAVRRCAIRLPVAAAAQDRKAPPPTPSPPPLPACDVPPLNSQATYQCRRRALPPPPLCTTPAMTPTSLPYPGRTPTTVHSACPPVPPADMRTTPYPSSTNASQSCIAAGVTNGLALIRVRGGNVVQLFCAGGKEYLLLPNTIGFSNYGQLQMMYTFFCAIRIDPSTLLVDTGDLTFSNSEGFTTRQWAFDRVPFGFAGDCIRGVGPGTAKIDLRSTPFALDESSAWTPSGFLPVGNARVHTGRQIADITGDGDCGWITPGRTRVELDNSCSTYQWLVQLRIANDAEGLALPPCGIPPMDRNATGCFADRSVALPSTVVNCSMRAPTPAPPTPAPTLAPVPITSGDAVTTTITSNAESTTSVTGLVSMSDGSTTSITTDGSTTSSSSGGGTNQTNPCELIDNCKACLNRTLTAVVCSWCSNDANRAGYCRSGTTAVLCSVNFPTLHAIVCPVIPLMSTSASSAAESTDSSAVDATVDGSDTDFVVVSSGSHSSQGWFLRAVVLLIVVVARQ